ncbi:DegT/DnrJ/EryC1/StrS family aminotransferase [Cohnella panacarvi]|uniref:DegT/DnrJ/EryC1/StrS family aminotransferase n=1 Tax=Cohnella panacarvi TaxID=400776 RepID=UPI00047ADCCB|nr:DegT/DnrJ/EryC1/StrS family aminotransferase [Cohnella panacarvi]
MAIQLFVPTYRVDECIEEIRQCLELGWTGIGFKTVEFESAWRAYTGHKHAHFVNSATAGLHLAVKILKQVHGWQDGDEIVSTPLTFVSTNHAILYEKMKVVFADVDEHLCMDPEDLERRIGPRTRAVMFVGLGGNTGQYADILAICRKHRLPLILDGAHMAGTRLHGEMPGKEADVAVYSFQAVKNLPTADSGMICFADEEMDGICRKYTWLGINKDTYTRTHSAGNYKWKYDVEYLGYKYHGNSVMAAIGLVQLRYLDEDNRFRRQVAQWYEDRLGHGSSRAKPIPVAADCESSRHLFMIESGNRDELLHVLNDNEIYPGVHYRDNTDYAMYAYGQGTCPRAHDMSGRILSLPMHLQLREEDVDRVCEIVAAHAKE